MSVSPRTAHGAYYAAHFGKSLLWTASDLVTIYALVSLFRVEARFAGWLFLGGLAANALSDLAVGGWLDRHPAHASWLAGTGLVVTALAFPATMLAASWGGPALMIVTLVFRLAYSAYDVPHNAMMSRLAADGGAATTLSRGRTLGTGAAAGIVGLALHFWPTSGGLAIALWLLAGSAALFGSALLPLLTSVPVRRTIRAAASGAGLPARFLVGSLLGIVALGALGKAILHLPTTMEHPDVGATLILLTAGRTVAAFLPLGFTDARQGQRLLACLYLVAIPALAVLIPRADWIMTMLLGLLLGSTNLIGWALLPLLARGARSYGLYTMTSKLALGAAGLVMTAALGGMPKFASGAFAWFVVIVLASCGAAALCLWPTRLTAPRKIGVNTL